MVLFVKMFIQGVSTSCHDLDNSDTEDDPGSWDDDHWVPVERRAIRPLESPMLRM